MDPKLPTTIRLTDEDHEIIAKLQALTGLESVTDVIRMSLSLALTKLTGRTRVLYTTKGPNAGRRVER
jgi:hypothetical protein